MRNTRLPQKNVQKKWNLHPTQARMNPSMPRLGQIGNKFASPSPVHNSARKLPTRLRSCKKAPADPESQLAASPATAAETSEISNIVDSVLADLKPKLMAEIAKKMSK